MLRIIHTADWHLGQTLVGYSREREHRMVLAELAALAAAREADALIVAGDVFDNQNPSGTSQRLYYETLMALKRARPAMTIVVTAGNHDAAGRLEAPSPILQAMDVHVIGNVRRTPGRIDGGGHVVELRNAMGDVAALVLAVSYPTSSCLAPPRSAELRSGKLQSVGLQLEDDRSDSYATRELYAELMQATQVAAPFCPDGFPRDRLPQYGVPLIVTGHLSVAGATESVGAERRIVIGGQHAVSADVFPSQAAYVALGHLHKAQDVKSLQPSQIIRYCGSLLPLSASEIDYAHGVSLVTLDGAAVVSVEHVPLARPVAFHRIPQRGEIKLEAVAEQLARVAGDPGLPTEQWPFVQISLKREGLSAGYRAELDRLAERFPLRLLEPRVARPEVDDPAVVTADDAQTQLADLDPEAMFAEAFLATHHVAPEAAHITAFRAAMTIAAEA